MLHVGDLDIADGTTRRQSLELGLQSQLIKRINRLGDMHMIAVGNIVAVGDTLNDAKPALQTFCKFVGGAFQRSAVQRVINVLGSLPLGAGGVQCLHNLQTESLTLRLGQLFAGDLINTLPQTGVTQADGAVAAMQQRSNGLSLAQAGKGAVLPQNGGGIGKGTLQPLVTTLQGTVAKLQPLLQYLPELRLVAGLLAGGAGSVHQVDGDNTLIETTIVLGLAVFIHIRGQEAAATHTGVAVTIAVFIHLQLQHDLFADVIRNHPAGGAFCGQLGQIEIGRIGVDIIFLQNIYQLGEGGGDPYTLLIFYTLPALLQGLLNNQGQILLFLLIASLTQVQEHCDKGGLTVGGEQRDNLVLNGLHAAANLITQPLFYHLIQLIRSDLSTGISQLLYQGGTDLITADLNKGRQMSQRDALAAVLVTGNLCNNLSGNIACGGEAMGTLDHSTGNDGTVLQHILQIDQVAVMHMLGKVVAIVEMNQTVLMGFYNILGKQDTVGDISADLTCHIVTLRAIDNRVLVAVFLLGLFVVALNQT